MLPSVQDSFKKQQYGKTHQKRGAKKGSQKHPHAL